MSCESCREWGSVLSTPRFNIGGGALPLRPVRVDACEEEDMVLVAVDEESPELEGMSKEHEGQEFDRAEDLAFIDGIRHK